MSTLSIRLPNSLHERVRELAAREGISINQWVATALAEKISALMTPDYLEAGARRGTRSKFVAALAQVPDVAPDPWDRLEERPASERLPPDRQSRQRTTRSRKKSPRARDRS
jgi:hypothetical protein